MHSIRFLFAFLFVYALQVTSHAEKAPTSTGSNTSAASTTSGTQKSAYSPIVPPNFLSKANMNGMSFHTCLTGQAVQGSFSNTTQSVPGAMGATVGANLSKSLGAQLQQAYQQGAGFDQISGIFQSGSPSLQGGCPSAGTANGEMTCEGDFKAKYQQFLAQNQALAGVYQCRDMKLNQILEEFRCIQSQSQSIEQQLQALGELYQQNMTAMQAVVTDYTAKGEHVDKVLGTKDSPGLNQLADRAKAFRDSLGGRILGLRTGRQNIKYKKASLEARKERLRLEETFRCFQEEKINPQYRCTTGGPAVSSLEALACRGQFAPLVDAKGKRRTQKQGKEAEKSALGQMGTALKNQITAVFQQALNSTPKSPTATKPGETAAPTNKGSKIFSLKEFFARYGNQFQSWDTALKFNVTDFVKQNLEYCQREYGNKLVKNEENKPGDTGVYEEQEAIKQMESQEDEAMRQMLNDFGTEFGEALNTMTPYGAYMTLPITDVKKQDPELKLTTIENLRAQYEDMYSGETGNFQMKTVIPGGVTGSIPPSGYHLCRSVLGCQKYYKAQKEEVVKQKKNYVQAARANMMQATRTFASQLQQRVLGLKDYLRTVSNVLASLGGGKLNLEKSDIDGEPLIDNGPDELYGMPSNMMALMNAYMTTPYPDVEAALADGSEGINDAKKEIAEDFSELSKKNADLQTSYQKCYKGQLTAMESVTEQMRSLGCLLEQSTKSSLRALIGDLGAVLGASFSDEISNIETGIARVKTAGDDLDLQIAEKQKILAGLDAESSQGMRSIASSDVNKELEKLLEQKENLAYCGRLVNKLEKGALDITGQRTSTGNSSATPAKTVPQKYKKQI